MSRRLPARIKPLPLLGIPMKVCQSNTAAAIIPADQLRELSIFTLRRTNLIADCARAGVIVDPTVFVARRFLSSRHWRLNVPQNFANCFRQALEPLSSEVGPGSKLPRPVREGL